MHVVIDDQSARDAYARLVEEAFAKQSDRARVIADGTTLRIRWEMCSRQMVQRLLHDDQNVQVKQVREVSGFSVARLKSHGFKKLLCDDGRQGLEPAVTNL